MQYEDSLQVTVHDYLTKALTAESFHAHVPNEIPAGGMKHRMKFWRQKQIGKGMRPGFPDILVIHKGRTVLIELKSEQGVTSRTQKALFPLLASAGSPPHVCRSLDEVVEVLELEGVPLKWKPLRLGGPHDGDRSQ